MRPIRARQTPLPTLSSSGPWLRQRLCCPPASRLTMATSELLPATVALSLIMSTALRWTEGPHFYLPALDDVPSSLFRWFQGALTKPPLGLAFANTEVARQPYVFRTPDCVRRMLRNCNVRFMLRPASLFAPLRTGRLLPSLPPLDRSNRKSVMTTGTFASSLTGLSPAALATLWAALRAHPCPSVVKQLLLGSVVPICDAASSGVTLPR